MISMTERECSKQHYQEIVKEMTCVKGMPATTLIAMMTEWILIRESKRSVCKNINGQVTQKMRECLIKLYCTLGEIQSQKERNESSILQKELSKVNEQVEVLKRERIKN